MPFFSLASDLGSLESWDSQALRTRKGEGVLRYVRRFRVPGVGYGYQLTGIKSDFGVR